MPCAAQWRRRSRMHGLVSSNADIAAGLFLGSESQEWIQS